MSPIPYGTIGTNWITTSWITAAAKTQKWRLHAIYSRSPSTAARYGAQHACTNLHTSLSTFAADAGMHAVYIASPNSLHFAQAKAMLQAGKHVILEKPATSTVAELEELLAVAAECGVYLIEAYRHIQEANYKLLRRTLVEERTLGAVYGASLTFASYSSRYEQVLAGETPNVLSLEFCGGSLVDVGVYPVTFAVAMFGKPKAQTYVPFLCPTGVDGGGVGILHYEGFGVQINNAKAYNSAAPCEIYTEKGTVRFAATYALESLMLWDRKGKESLELAEHKCVEYEKPNVNMQEEAEEFARIIGERDEVALRQLEEISRNVIAVTTDMRAQAGVVYPADRR